MAQNERDKDISFRSVAGEKSRSPEAESAARRKKSGTKDTLESIVDFVAHHVEGEEGAPDMQDVSDGSYKDSEHGDAEDRDEFMEMED